MIKQGSLIHEETPFVHVLNSNLRLLRCDNCYKKCELLKCSGCGYVRYCDRGCQKLAWVDHKSECPNLRRLPTGKVLPNAARLISRIISKLKRGGSTVIGRYDKNKHRVFKDLMSHYSDLKEDKKRLEHVYCLYQVLRDFLGEEDVPNTAEFLGIYGRVVVNTFNILDEEMGNIGSGIYLGASTIDHSCEPNAVATFRSTTIYIRTLEDIPDFSWSKVRISYIDLLRERTERQDDLQAQYYFLCDCRRCSDPDEENLMSSMSCPKCSAPITTNSPGEKPDCGSCGAPVALETISSFKQVVQFTREQHAIMKDIAYLDMCKRCLEREEGLLHPLNILHVKTLDLAFESSLQLGQWSDALAFGENLLPGYRRYYGKNHPLLGLHYMRLGKLYLLKEKLAEALSALDLADSIISVTHGKTHELYKNQLSPLLLDAKCSSFQIINAPTE